MDDNSFTSSKNVVEDMSMKCKAEDFIESHMSEADAWNLLSFKTKNVMQLQLQRCRKSYTISCPILF